MAHDVGLPAEVDDRIADELTGTVERDVAPAIDVVQLGAARRDHLLRDDEVRAVAEPADGEHRRVLEEQEVVVVVTTRHAALVDGALEIPGLLVREAAEPAGPHPGHDSSCSQSQPSIASLIRRRNSTAVEPSNAR